jgi:choline-sulfatase
MSTRRPNILLIMVDQLAPQALPVHGHPVVQAPNLSRLAEDSVVFESAYCNFPLCAPARYVMMSGRLPSAIGAYDNAAEFPAEVPTFAHYLRRQGYRTTLTGKMHFCGPDQLHGFEERLTTDVYPADFTWTPDWDRPGERLSWYHEMTSVTQAGPCLRSNNLDYDDEVIFTAKRHLFDLARGNEGRPFCLVVSMIHPHDPYTIRPRYWDLYEDAEIDPPSVELAPEELDPHSARVRRCIGLEELPITREQTLAARRAYYGAISYVDEQVGDLLNTLKEAGFAEDTVVLFTGDHGDMLGERGLWYKMTWFEWSARVPLFVHAPGTFRPRRVPQSVSLMDLLPTLAEIGGDGAAPELATPIEGRSLVPHLSGSGGHDEVLGEYTAEGTPDPLFMIRRGRYKFVTSQSDPDKSDPDKSGPDKGDPDQLYDLEADPRELVNLAGAPEHAEALGAFRDEAARRWDSAALRERILESQRRRRLVAESWERSTPEIWDYQPVRDASQDYIRNTMTLWEIEGRSRFPRAGD